MASVGYESTDRRGLLGSYRLDLGETCLPESIAITLCTGEIDEGDSRSNGTWYSTSADGYDSIL